MDRTSRSRISRVLALVFANVLLALVLLEAMGVAYAYLAHGETYATMDDSKRAAASHLPPGTDGVREAPSDQDLQAPDPMRSPRPSSSPESGKGPLQPWRTLFNHPRRLHPYFGFTYDPHSRENTNNHGFAEKVDFPYRAEPGEFVVGLFGGSVAMGLSLGEPRRILERGIGRLVAPLGYEGVRVLCFAQADYQQPMTLFTYLYYLGSVNLAVFLDGFNEIMRIPPLTRLVGPRRPLDFPSHVYDALARRAKPSTDTERARALAEIALLRERQRAWLELASHTPLSRSMLVHSLWRAAHAQAELAVGRHQERLTRRVRRTFAIENVDGVAPAARVDEFFEKYARYVRSAWAAGRSLGKPVFHFVQPNPHVPGSKPLSARERALVAEGASNYRAKVADYYPRLRAMSRFLAEEGVPSTDLTAIFEDHEETLYVDACCHLNTRGMTRLSEAIVESIAASGWPVEMARARIPSTGAPPRPRHDR